MIRVAVAGATGRVGAEVCRAIAADPDLELVAGVSRSAAGRTVAEAIGLSDAEVVLTDRLDAVLDASPDVLVDFTSPSFAPEHVAWGIEHGVHVVVGTTGFPVDPAWGEQDRVGVIVAPNFAIGAVLMMRFAEEAARFIAAAEIIELHREGKADAPSGTAMATAERIAAARPTTPDVTGGDEERPGARGTDVHGVRVHAVRLPGLVAHQEVVFGATGQTLSIRHDTSDRSAFMPGVLLAIKAVPTRPGLTVGLDPLLDG